MPLDLGLFSGKINNLLAQLMVSHSEMAEHTGIPIDRIQALGSGRAEPTGDEVLIFADFFMCDYRSLISNQNVQSFQQTDLLFRRYGSDFPKEDRKVIREVYYLAEHEHDLEQLLGVKIGYKNFDYSPQGAHYKQHGIDAANELRNFLQYNQHEISRDVFSDLRKINIHVFRRHFGNSDISGVAFRHPVAGKCILINYDQDIYRQRFTAMHEAAHAIFDLDNDKDQISVSFKKRKWTKEDLKEFRANSFASEFLLPRKILQTAYKNGFEDADLVSIANRLLVNPEALCIALVQAKIIDQAKRDILAKRKIPIQQKIDPELPEYFSPREAARKRYLLEKGLSSYYVRLCFRAYQQNFVTLSKVAEMLLLGDEEIVEIQELYGVKG